MFLFLTRLFLSFTLLVLTACAELPLYQIKTKRAARTSSSTISIQQLLKSQQNPQWLIQPSKVLWLSPVLNAQSEQLLDEAIIGNENIAQYLTLVDIAELRYRQIKTQREPDLDVNLVAQRSATSNTIQNELNLGFNLTWDVDVWGRLKISSQQAYVDWLISLSDYQYQKNQLFTELLGQYIDNAQQQEKINIFEARMLKLQQQAVAIEDNYLNGITQARDVLQAKSDIQEIASQIELLKDTLETGNKRLLRLIGRKPQRQASLPTLDWKKIDVIRPLPEQWQLEQVMFTPAIQQQWLQLLNQDAELAIAHRNRLPQLIFSSSAGFNNSSINNLINHQQLFWNLLGQLTQPILNQRELKLEVKKQRLELKRQELAYTQSIYNTLSQLYQYYIREQHLQNRYQINKKLLNTRILNETLALDEYLQNIIDYDSLLQSQRNVLDARSTLVDLAAQIYQNRLQIFFTLGGENQPLFIESALRFNTKQTEKAFVPLRKTPQLKTSSLYLSAQYRAHKNPASNLRKPIL